MTDEVDDRTLLLAALQQMHIRPSREEVDAMAAAYPAARLQADALYEVPDVRYQAPSITFDPRTVHP